MTHLRQQLYEKIAARLKLIKDMDKSLPDIAHIGKATTTTDEIIQTGKRVRLLYDCYVVQDQLAQLGTQITDDDIARLWTASGTEMSDTLCKLHVRLEMVRYARGDYAHLRNEWPDTVSFDPKENSGE